MENNTLDYKWGKVRNGIPSAPIVNILVKQSLDNRHKVIECYSGKGFEGQGHIEEVSEIGYDSWKIAARLGLEYAFSLTDKFWTVTINKIRGRAFTDSNPTVVGYVIFRAFFAQIGEYTEESKITELEEFVLKSWKKPYRELIPNFFSRTFSEYTGYEK